ncbi:MAG TPA: hypothetical protein VFD43_08865 [Planctomycetota bacterium]|nr:hypothetical protein [Planctomycetota bacterium]
MSPLIRAILWATGAAIVGVVLYQQFVTTGDDQSWETFARAIAPRDQAGQLQPEELVQALEAARDEAAGSAAGPWIEYELAMSLYTLGGSANFERSRQVAQATVAAYPTHAATPWLRRLIEAIDSYEGAATAQ